MFSRKEHTFFVDSSEDAIRFARVSRLAAPVEVSEVREFGASAHGAIADALKGLTAGHGYVRANCGISPIQRSLQRLSLDPKKLRDPGFRADGLSAELKLDLQLYRLMMVGAVDGVVFDPEIANPSKEWLACGVSRTELNTQQESMLKIGFYPERVEVTSVAALGAFSHYARLMEFKSPALYLEIHERSSFAAIVSATGGVELTREIPCGFDSMVPVIQKELGLKDEEASRKLLYSNSFDFTAMGLKLVRRLSREVQSSIGFYEVQTGQTVGHLLCRAFAPGMPWLDRALAETIGVSTVAIDWNRWLPTVGITLAEGINRSLFDARWFGLFALMADLNQGGHEKP
jgi:hypothetical protein